MERGIPHDVTLDLENLPTDPETLRLLLAQAAMEIVEIATRSAIVT